MEFFKNIFELLKNIFLEQWQVLSAIGAVVLVIVPIIWKQKKELYTEQLYKVYLPLFKQIEPILYSKIIQPYDNDFQEIKILMNTLLENHYELFFPDTIVHYHRLINNLGTKKYWVFIWDYKAFCINVDEKFESLRRKLFLPVRGIDYKTFHHQYPYIAFQIFHILRLLFAILVAAFLAYCVVALGLVIVYFLLHWFETYSFAP